MVLSSTASIVCVTPEPKVFSEKDWNEQAIEIVREQGKSAPAMAKYRASKTLAEKGTCLISGDPCICVNLNSVAAWEFVEKNKDKISWDLVVLNPPFVRFLFPMHLFIRLVLFYSTGLRRKYLNFCSFGYQLTPLSSSPVSTQFPLHPL